MADFLNALPTRIADYANPDTQQAVVDTDNNLHVEVHGNNPAAGDEVLRLSELGAVTPDGFYDATNNTVPGNVGLVGHTRAASPAGTDQVQRLTAKTGTTDTDVHALDISLHDQNGNAYTAANPLSVFVAPSPATEVHDYDTQASLAAAGVDNHDYTVAGSAFTLYKVLATASAQMKIEVQYDPDGVSGFTTIAVGFNSNANPNIEIDFGAIGFEVAVAGIVRVARTNRDNKSQDVYSTIVGSLA